MQPSDPEEALRAFIGFWISPHSLAPGTKRERLYNSFHRDINVVYSYLNAYAGKDVTEQTWRAMNPHSPVSRSQSTTREIGRVAEALMLPVMLRLDPQLPETVRWAQLFLPFREQRWRDEYVLKSRPLVAARYFHSQGVAPEFAAMFYEPLMSREAMGKVVSLAEAGIPYEYVRELVAQGLLLDDAVARLTGPGGAL